MNILITGVAGFIGGHLAEQLLQEGFNVLGIDNFDSYYRRDIKEENLKLCKRHPNFKFIEGDIRQLKRLVLNAKSIDLVIHLAAKVSVLPSLQNPQTYIDTNISGTQAVLDFMRANKILKLIFASSSSIYGNNKKVPFCEVDEVNHPISPYAYTKKTNELMIAAYHQLYGIDAMCLRFFTVYGPRQRPDLAIHKFVRLIQARKSITMYGDGNSARDYTYISDIIDGILLTIQYLGKQKHIYEIINLGNNQPVALKDMIAIIYEVCNKPSNIVQLPMQPGDVAITYADIEKAQSLLGYLPKMAFGEGIKEFVDWYQKKKTFL